MMYLSQKMLMFKRLLGFAIMLTLLALSAHLHEGETVTQSMLRLGWICNGQEIKIPLVQDPNLPAHMRLPEDKAFKISLRNYSLRVNLDGKTILEKRVIPGGVHHDRPLSVFEEIVVSPGRHQVEVDFSPEPVAGVTDTITVEPYRAEIDFAPAAVHLIIFQDGGQWQTKS